MNNIWSELKLEKMTENPNRCGGPNDCENRKYDETKEDCQRCMKECEGENV